MNCGKKWLTFLKTSTSLLLAVLLSFSSLVVFAAGDNTAEDSDIITAQTDTPKVEKIKITVKVNNTTRKVGKADPVFIYSLVGGSLLPGHYLRDAGIVISHNGVKKGKYPLVATTTNPFYEVKSINGTMTLN